MHYVAFSQVPFVICCIPKLKNHSTETWRFDKFLFRPSVSKDASFATYDSTSLGFVLCYLVTWCVCVCVDVETLEHRKLGLLRTRKRKNAAVLQPNLLRRRESRQHRVLPRGKRPPEECRGSSARGLGDSLDYGRLMASFWSLGAIAFALRDGFYVTIEIFCTQLFGDGICCVSDWLCQCFFWLLVFLNVQRFNRFLESVAPSEFYRSLLILLVILL